MSDTFQAFNLRDENGVGYGVKNINGKPRVSTMPYTYDIAEGNVSGHEAWSKIGFTPVMTTTESDVWSRGGSYAFLTTATKLSVWSSSANDAAAGFGARTLTVKYLDADYNQGTEVVTLNGTTPVAMSGSILRVNSFRVATAGSANATSGSVQIFNNSAGSAVYSFISPAMTRARNACYTVPAGKALYVTNVSFSFGYSSSQTHYARMYTRASQNDGVYTGTIFYPYSEVICANSAIQLDLTMPTKLIEKVDIKISGIATVAGTASCVLRGWLEDV